MLTARAVYTRKHVSARADTQRLVLISQRTREVERLARNESNRVNSHTHAGARARVTTHAHAHTPPSAARAHAEQAARPSTTPCLQSTQGLGK